MGILFGALAVWDGVRKEIEKQWQFFIKKTKNNYNKDLPSNEVLFMIFKLLFECEDNDKKKTSSCYMNQYEHYANYITKYWNKE